MSSAPATSKPSVSELSRAQPAAKKAFKMYRHDSSTERNLVLADFTTAKAKESTIDFLTRVETDAAELAKRIYGSILFTRCRSVAAFYTVIESDADGFTSKRYVDVSSCASLVPDMRAHPNFPKALLLRLAADARHNAENNVVSLTVLYRNCDPKPNGEVIATTADSA